MSAYRLTFVGMLAVLSACGLALGEGQKKETVHELAGRIWGEGHNAYKASRFSELSRDYFSRFSRDPDARPGPDEIVIDKDWKIVLSSDAGPLAGLMAGHLAEFLKECMGVESTVEELPPDQLRTGVGKVILLMETGGGVQDVPESFTISVDRGLVIVRGRDPAGLRDGVVRLVDRMGLREAPILEVSDQAYRPRLRVRLGTVPFLGSYRDLVFMGFNATWASGGDLYAASTSDAIPELKDRRNPGVLKAGALAAQAVRQYGLKTYAHFSTKQKFPKDHPVFEAHPDMRGALTWQADGDYVLCTEHPAVRRFLTESVAGVFREISDLDGIVFINGGEGFYHCYMRSYGPPKGRGRTNCKRCDPLGAETVVANLANAVTKAVREVSPKAEVVWWPYSASHVWSADRAQAGFIEKLGPGNAIFTEIEKDEYVAKADGVNKHLWDYSIDLIGPGQRAKDQIAACRAVGIPIYMKSEPELGFEAPRLPHIPCMDRWVDRAEALASCGADGAWVFPAFRPCYGTSAAEVSKLLWWDPVPDKEELLNSFARRIAGVGAGPHVRKAWKHVSDAIAWSPELPSYYTGPYYLGPAHPMCADPKADLPEVFYGYYFFYAEATDAEGAKKRPTFVTSPTGNALVFGKFYRRMEALLADAVAELEAAAPLVGQRHRLMFMAEASPVRWFYHTARAEANFYESCQLRDRLLALAARDSRTTDQMAEARRLYRRWREVLLDEKANAAQALPVMQADVRLNFRYGGDHSFSDGAEMLRAKLDLIGREIDEFLPSVARQCGIDPEE